MDELSPGARALLSAASSSDDPTSEDQERVRHAVLLRVGAIGIGTAALASRTAQAKGLLGTFSSKVGAALVVVLGGSAATYVALQPKAEPAPVTISAAARTPTAAAQEKDAKPASAAEQQALQVEDLPTQEAKPQQRSAARAQAVAPADVKEEEAPAVEKSKQATQDSFGEERQLISSADTALKSGMTGQAVSLLAEHAARFPRGMLANEREGLRLVARCQGGAKQSTRAAAQSFVDRLPKYTVSARVRSACGLDH